MSIQRQYPELSDEVVEGVEERRDDLEWLAENATGYCREYAQNILDAVEAQS